MSLTSRPDVAIGAQPRLDGVVELRRPLLRTALTVARDMLASVPDEAYRERLVMAGHGPLQVVYLCDPSLIQDTIVRKADRLAKTDDLDRVLGPALGQGLLTADGAVWRWQRQALASAFQHERLRAMLPQMVAAAERTRDRLLALPPGGAFDLQQEMMRTTLEIIIQTMMPSLSVLDASGVGRDSADYLAATTWMFAYALLGLPRWMPHPGRGRALRAARRLRERIGAAVVARRRQGGDGEDLMARLLQAVDPETGRRLDDMAVVDNLVTFVSAGHETTALAMTWTLALLTRHPDVAAKVRAEAISVVGQGSLNAGGLERLDYTRQVIQEAMRLYPPAPIISRKVLEPVEVEGITLRRDAVIVVPIYHLHRNERLWEQAGTFDPGRFGTAASQARHRFAYMPFGAGPRVCIGNSFAMMEAVAILAVLANSPLFERLAVTPLPRPQMHITLRPRDPILVNLR